MCFSEASRDLAKISLIGRVGNELVVETSQSGRDFIKYSLACQTSPDRTSWFRIVNFDPRLNTYMLSFIKKGQRALVYVDGTVQLNPYTTEDGKKHTNISVIQRSVQVLRTSRESAEKDVSQEAVDKN
ncbi:hypothetical protein T552_00177 [Pneumocystis carinii B80]|uniref:Single-stranded DNA-binding protein n=1 Tax=Pneumocystis carinii (strain B80) TaxID=1408658 RepID=A0A0W4ZT34_PNEC8|nr:hypothetical protein T552_00177 [Pneumocystis carinii B80]KTW31535.1 hypothetical protein T552_00177 [Pneumocystis carinii B80]